MDEIIQYIKNAIDLNKKELQSYEDFLQAEDKKEQAQKDIEQIKFSYKVINYISENMAELLASINITEDTDPFVVWVLINEYVMTSDKIVKELAKESAYDDIKDFINYFKQQEPAITELQEDVKKDNSAILKDAMPTSRALFLTNRFINSIGSGHPLAQGKGETISKSKKNKKVSIVSENKNSNITITHNDVSLLKSKSNKGLIKILAFIMQEANAQNFNRQVVFPLQKLVDVGMYKSTRSARNQFKENIVKLMGFIIQGEEKRGNKTIKEAGGVLITTYTIDNSTVTISLNPDFNTKILAEYFTILPQYVYSLSSNGFSLLQYIFFIARQNTDKIAKQSKFNIGIESIRSYLCLPAPEDTKEHLNLIRKPIENAIEEVEEIEKTNKTNNTIHITPHYNEPSNNIRVWLEGYLEIELCGDYADYFKEIESNKKKVLQKAEQRKDKAQQKALENIYTKHLEKTEVE